MYANATRLEINSAMRIRVDGPERDGGVSEKELERYEWEGGCVVGKRPVLAGDPKMNSRSFFMVFCADDHFLNLDFLFGVALLPGPFFRALGHN